MPTENLLDLIHQYRSGQRCGRFYSTSSKIIDLAGVMEDVPLGNGQDVRVLYTNVGIAVEVRTAKKAAPPVQPRLPIVQILAVVLAASGALIFILSIAIHIVRNGGLR